MTENIYNLEIFKWVSHDIVEKIISDCEERNFKEGEKIIQEWEKSNWEWYILKSGRVSIKIWWKKIAELSSWDIFWEIALLNEEERTATIVALTDIEVIILKYDDLIEMIEYDANYINKKIINRVEENFERLL